MPDGSPKALPREDVMRDHAVLVSIVWYVGATGATTGAGAPRERPLYIPLSSATRHQGCGADDKRLWHQG